MRAETLGALTLAIYGLGAVLVVARLVSAGGRSGSLGVTPQRQA